MFFRVAQADRTYGWGGIQIKRRGGLYSNKQRVCTGCHSRLVHRPAHSARHVHPDEDAVLALVVDVLDVAVDEAVVVPERGPVLLSGAGRAAVRVWAATRREPREGETVAVVSGTGAGRPSRERVPVAGLAGLRVGAGPAEAHPGVALLPELVPAGPAHDGLRHPVGPAAVQHAF
eukprot:605383-Hanusia_phi.AAC.8